MSMHKSPVKLALVMAKSGELSWGKICMLNWPKLMTYLGFVCERDWGKGLVKGHKR